MEDNAILREIETIRLLTVRLTAVFVVKTLVINNPKQTFGEKAWPYIWLRSISRDLRKAGQQIQFGYHIAQKAQWLHVTAGDVHHLVSNAFLLLGVLCLYLQTQNTVLPKTRPARR